jgi:hypothetical protein
MLFKLSSAHKQIQLIIKPNVGREWTADLNIRYIVYFEQNIYALETD